MSLSNRLRKAANEYHRDANANPLSVAEATRLDGFVNLCLDAAKWIDAASAEIDKAESMIDLATENGRLEGAYWGLGIATQSHDFLAIAAAAAQVTDPDTGWNAFERDTDAGRAWRKMHEQAFK